jgi:hypothetical protein
MSASREPREAGQAAVETALTLPLTLFLVLGTIQLFMSMQARLMAHYAVARATRAGSLTSGDCTAMLHTALLALLPTFDRTDTPANLVAAFANSNRILGHFDPARDDQRSEDIVWIDRIHPLAAEIPANEEEVFDLGAPSGVNPRAHTLEVKMIFWYPLRIPFANWVISKLVLAQWNWDTLNGANPLIEAQRAANWRGPGLIPSLDAMVADEMKRRDQAHHYAIPIQTTFTMRMMTPARSGPANFAQPSCSPCPGNNCAVGY